MSWMSKSSTTTALLGVIALLLLVLVIQNATRHPGTMMPPHGGMTAEAPFHGGEAPQGGMPAGHGITDSSGNFDPAIMIMAAMKCPDQPALTLDADACSGNKVDEYRNFVREIQGQNQSPRAVFDAIVKKFGEDALTDEAINIRRSRRAAK